MKSYSIQDLKPGMIANQTICDSRGIILIARGVTLTESYINRLHNFKIHKVMIQEEIDSSPLPTIISPAVRKTMDTLTTLFKNLAANKIINVQDNAFKIEQVLYSVLEKPTVQAFLEIDPQKDFLFHHSLRTTIIALHMGLLQGYDYLNLEYLAMCALMHDCGMGQDFIEENTDHAFLGFEKLRNNLDIDMIISLVCLQHHECYDGSGPLSFRKVQITEFARLIAIADHYDRLIMKNNSPRQAIFKIVGSSGTLFDPSMIKLFEATITSLANT
jgi:HD-GYP domain-containing protein (c-di-GMP phosphodiesterase class II)